MPTSRLAIAAALSLSLTLAAAPAAADKASDTLRVAFAQTIENPDSYYNSAREGVVVARHIWDTLIERDPDTLEYRPALATAWRWLDDTTLEFTIRPGVTFHNGDVLTAEDVAFTLNFAADPASGIKTPSNASWIREAVVTAPDTVRILLKEPFPVALEYVASVLPIYPKAYYQRVGPKGMGEAPVGTGPYRAVRMVQGQDYLLEAYKDHYAASPKGKPRIGRLNFRFLPEASTQIAELVGGGLDLIWRVSPDQMEGLSQVPGFKTVSAESMRVAYLGFNLRGKIDGPLGDPRVRRAIAHAVDRTAIVKNLVRGQSSVVDTPCFPTQFGCDVTAAVRYDYDPAKARRLLAEAGYPNGFEVELQSYEAREWPEALMGYLGAVGIKPRFTPMTYFALRDRNREGKSPMHLMGWGSFAINDASAILNVFFAGSPDDVVRDPELKALLDVAGSSGDAALRMGKYQQAVRIITDQVYWLPLWTHVTNYAFADSVAFKAYPDELPRFYLTRWN